MKKYFYCKSYQNFLIALKYRFIGDEIVIITSEDDIVKTCKELGLDFVCFLHYRHKFIANNLKKIQNEIDELCKKISPGLLYFSHTQYDVYCFLLVQHYSMLYGKVIFFDHELELDKYRYHLLSFFDYKIFLNKLQITKYFNIDLILREHSHQPLIAIDHSFLIKNKIEIINTRNTFFDELYDGSIHYQIKMNPIKSLFLLQDLNNLINNHGELDAINNYIIKKKLTIKAHPYFKTHIDCFNNNPQVSAHYPAELLFNNVNGVVISIGSLSLITASRFPQIKSVSLLNMVKLKDVKLENKLRNLLATNSFDKIFFPKSFQEVDDLINCK